MGLKKTYNDLLALWGYSEHKPPPPPSAPSPPQSGPTPDEIQWEMIYRKFRQIHRRDPYSFKELQDWWDYL